MLECRQKHGAAAWGKRVIVAGGRSFHSEKVEDLLCSVEVFDLGKNVWKSLGNLKHPRENCGVWTKGDQVFVFGGICGNVLDSVEVCQNGEWVQLQIKMPVPIERFGIVELGHDKILIIGGRTLDGVLSNKIWEIN